ncbi:MAG: hypothetical protein DRP55_02275 [Spirochaetes bacterium]|nr:MAG: hypothetical protein DRP55_02275 [Spirochaetota bacterium]
MIFTLLHFTCGRTVSVIYAVVNQMDMLFFIPLALFYDWIQIPIFGILLEQSTSRLKVLSWLKKRVNKAMESMENKAFLRRIINLGDIGVILVSALPIRGFGILSGSILTFFMKKGRKEGSFLLLTGSLMGIFITMALATSAMDLIKGYIR